MQSGGGRPCDREAAQTPYTAESFGNSNLQKVGIKITRMNYYFIAATNIPGKEDIMVMMLYST